MRTIQLYLVLATLIIGNLSCSKTGTYKPSEATVLHYPLLFKTATYAYAYKKVKISYELRAQLSGDTILFAQCVENMSTDTLKLNPSDLQIETEKGIRSDVVIFDTKRSILPNSTESIYYKFLPVNNLKLYKRTKYCGDMDSSYYLNLDFISRNNIKIPFPVRIKFCLDKNSYKEYLKNYAKNDKITLYNIKDKITLKTLIINKLNLTDSNNVQLSETDILVNNVNTSLNFYQQDSTLNLNIRVINHGETLLLISPDKLFIKRDDEILAPKLLAIHAANPLTGSKMYPIPRGGRAEFELQYSTHDKDEITLSTDGILNSINKKPLLLSPIYYVADTTNN